MRLASGPLSEDPIERRRQIVAGFVGESGDSDRERLEYADHILETLDADPILTKELTAAHELIRELARLFDGEDEYVLRVTESPHMELWRRIVQGDQHTPPT